VHGCVSHHHTIRCRCHKFLCETTSL